MIYLDISSKEQQQQKNVFNKMIINLLNIQFELEKENEF